MTVRIEAVVTGSYRDGPGGIPVVYWRQAAEEIVKRRSEQPQDGAHSTSATSRPTRQLTHQEYEYADAVVKTVEYWMKLGGQVTKEGPKYTAGSPNGREALVMVDGDQPPLTTTVQYWLFKPGRPGLFKRRIERWITEGPRVENYRGLLYEARRSIIAAHEITIRRRMG